MGEYAFADSSFLVARFNIRDRNHRAAIAHVEEQRHAGSDALRLVLSDYVFDETVTALVVRSKRHDLASAAGRAILASKNLRIVRVVRGGEGDEQRCESPGRTAAVRRHRNGHLEAGDRSVREREEPRRCHDEGEGEEDRGSREARDWNSHGSSTTSTGRRRGTAPSRRRSSGASDTIRTGRARGKSRA